MYGNGTHNLSVAEHGAEVARYAFSHADRMECTQTVASEPSDTQDYSGDRPRNHLIALASLAAHAVGKAALGCPDGGTSPE